MTKPPPSKLPAEATIGLTPFSRLFIQLAPKP